MATSVRRASGLEPLVEQRAQGRAPRGADQPEREDGLRLYRSSRWLGAGRQDGHQLVIDQPRPTSVPDGGAVHQPEVGLAERTWSSTSDRLVGSVSTKWTPGCSRRNSPMSRTSGSTAHSVLDMIVSRPNPASDTTRTAPLAREKELTVRCAGAISASPAAVNRTPDRGARRAWRRAPGSSARIE